MLPGFVAFVTAAIIFYVKPLCDQCHTDIQLREKLIFLFFFVGAILCLGMSAVFHTGQKEIQMSELTYAELITGPVFTVLGIWAVFGLYLAPNGSIFKN